MSDYEILGINEMSNIFEIDMAYKKKLVEAYIAVANREDDLVSLVNIYKSYNNVINSIERNPIKNEVNNYIFYQNFYEFIDMLYENINLLNGYIMVDNIGLLNRMRNLLLNMINETYKIINMLRNINSIESLNKVKIFYNKKSLILLVNFKNEFLNYMRLFYPGIIYTTDNINMIRDFNSLDSLALIPYFLRDNIGYLGNIMQINDVMQQENERVNIPLEYLNIKDNYDKEITDYVKKNKLNSDEYAIKYGNNKYYDGLKECLKEVGLDIEGETL